LLLLTVNNICALQLSENANPKIQLKIFPELDLPEITGSQSWSRNPVHHFYQQHSNNNSGSRDENHSVTD